MVAPVQEWPNSIYILLHPTAPSHLDLNQLSPEGRVTGQTLIRINARGPWAGEALGGMERTHEPREGRPT
jgi:hypothetical protein